MLKRFLTYALIAIFIHVTSARPLLAHSLVKKETPSVEKIKKSIDKLGVGEKARTTVKLKDGRKFKGYIYQTNENDFVLVEKSGQKITIAYADVAGVKGKNLSTGTKIAIGVGIGAATTIIILGIAVAVSLGVFSH